MQRALTEREEESLSRYFEAHERYEAMRLLLRYEDGELLGPLALSGKRVLELGCGSLPVLLAAPKRDFAYVGTDFSRKGLRLAQRIASGGRYVACDAMLPALAPARFDVIIMKNLLHHLERPEVCLRAVRTLLAPGGTVVVLEPNSACLAGTLAKRLLGLLGRQLEESPYGQLSVSRLREAFRAAGFEVASVHHSGFVAFPLSGDYASLKLLPMSVGLWRGILTLDRALSGLFRRSSWLAALLAFKVVFHLEPAPDEAPV